MNLSKTLIPVALMLVVFFAGCIFEEPGPEPRTPRMAVLGAYLGDSRLVVVMHNIDGWELDLGYEMEKDGVIYRNEIGRVHGAPLIYIETKASCSVGETIEITLFFDGLPTPASLVCKADDGFVLNNTPVMAKVLEMSRIFIH